MATETVLDTLLFVDTNVLLDFYRIRKSDVGTKYLEQLEACRDRLIIGSQIEMEYKKNRQRVILEAQASFGAPDWAKLTAPALVSDLQAVKAIEKKKKELLEQKNKVAEKIKKILILNFTTTILIKINSILRFLLYNHSQIYQSRHNNK